MTSIDTKMHDFVTVCASVVSLARVKELEKNGDLRLLIIKYSKVIENGAREKAITLRLFCFGQSRV